MKKLLAGLLSLIMIFGVIGCSNSNNSSQATNSGQKSDPIKLTFMCQVNVDTEGYDVNDNPYIKYIREANNLDITLISESADYASKVSAIMASGTMPDYVQLPKNLYFQYAQSDLLVKLDDMLNETNYPHLMSGIDEKYWEYTKVDGSIYAIPFCRYDTTPYLSMARKDWMDKLGIDPTTLKTVDDYYDLLYAFTFNDPDGNGVNDTYGLSSCNSNGAYGSVGERYIGMLFADAFGASEYRVIDGVLTPNYITDNYKDYLAFLAKLYADGIIVPEYITKTQKETEEEFRNGKFGVLNLFWSLSEHNDMRDYLYPLTPPERVDGSGQSKYVYHSPIRHYIGITTDCKNPEAVLALYDWAETDAGAEFVHAGTEGWDWDRKDGKLVIRPDRVGINWAWRFITLGHQKSHVDDQLMPILTQSWGELAISELKLSEEYGTNDALYVASPIFSELSDYDLDTYVTQYRNQAIMGQVNLDETWDSYVAGWKSAGGDTWLKLYTEWYKTTQ